MAAHHPPLARLHIPHQGSSSISQPTFTPTLPTVIQQTFNMHTPLQSSFGSHVPSHPQPRHGLHRAHPSLMLAGPAAALAAAGIAPPSGLPVTPGAIPPHMVLSGPLFQRGTRRTPSMSTGGPPKALLGGPNRKHSPMPATPGTSSNMPILVDKPKVKKVILKLPVERIVHGGGEEDSQAIYSLWARWPLAHSAVPSVGEVRYPNIMTMEPHPIEQFISLPGTIDVFLPGKGAWDEYKQRLIEEKLQRLGVERGANFGPTGPSHTHGRAASISSPADPALLLFKLNKLQQSQTTFTSVPQPRLPSISVSPGPLPPRFQNAKHGHSLSLANFTTPPPQPPQFYNPSTSSNLFTPGGTPCSTFEPNQYGHQRDSPPHLHAPQGVVPLSLNMHSDATTTSSGPSRVASTIPDFNRGFGLDIPEEEEEQGEEMRFIGGTHGVAAELLPEEAGAEGEHEMEDDSTTAPAHSRHVSKVSVTLSLKSTGGLKGTSYDEDTIELMEDNVPPELERPVEWNLNARSSMNHVHSGETEAELDPVCEWTASEDGRSLEEYSNPSDEEKAFQVRVARREAKARQRLYQDQETPRRLPNFPRPPDGGPLSHLPTVPDEDIVSNPSEENNTQDQKVWLHPAPPQQEPAQYQPVVDGQLRSPRPLPPLPHSRTASGNHSLHSALIHSRQGSSMINDVVSSISNPGSTTISLTRRDSLNPFAKPFVFGAASFESKLANSSQAEGSTAGHARQQSIGRILNASAAEFKPTGFTFCPPEGVPKLSFGTSESPRPLPQVPVVSPSRFQGREKRQRRGSSKSDERERESVCESKESDGFREMSSYRFPSSPSPDRLALSAVPQRVISPLPQRTSALNASAPPFKFPASSTLTLPFTFTLKESSTHVHPLAPVQSTSRAHSLIPIVQTQSEPGVVASPDLGAKEVSSETAASNHPSPSPLRKRPPVLDFKHPISTNTAPASLFRKTLTHPDVDGPTRTSVRSRLSSREIFEHMNSPSLDDTNVPTISRRSNLPNTRVTTTLPSRPGHSHNQPVDVFTAVDDVDAKPQKQELVERASTAISPVSGSMHTPYERPDQEADQIEHQLKDLLDNRMEAVKRDLAEMQALTIQEIVGQIVTAVASHNSESVPGGSADARGEVDFELVRNTLEQGIVDIRTGLRHDLEEVMKGVESVNLPRERLATSFPADFHRVVEEFGNRTVSAVTNAVVKFASRIDQIDEFARVRAADERDLLLNDLFNVLAPRLEALRQQPIDFDVVTAKLAEAVKPHISQLIDLTSDKKETAGLIVQRLMPTLSALSQTQAHVDTDAIVSQLRVEVARMAPASDPHVIKEAVADLVVERLDSRLAVREKSASSEHLYSRISERIDDLYAPVSDVRKAIEDLRMGQMSIKEQGVTLNTLHQDMAAQLLGLPKAIEGVVATIQAAKDQWKVVNPTDVLETSSRLNSIESIVRTLASNYDNLASQATNLISLHDNLHVDISALPQSILEATATLKEAQLELASLGRTPDQSMEIKTLVASNAEFQVQIAKARGAHGQIRVEKDLMHDRMLAAESERDALRVQLEDMRSNGASKEMEVTAAGLKITELEDALSHSLARLQSSDVTTQAKDERIATLERQNRDIGLEQYQLKSQIQKLELQSEWLIRDKETVERRLSQLQEHHDLLINQQSHWEALRRTSDQVEQLTRLVGAAEEVAELKRDRDHYKVLEGEHASLQKRFQEQEARFTALDRASQTMRQHLVQSQQHESEWEKRAKELEAELDVTRARLDDADEVKLQLDSDLSLVKMHLEEKEAAEIAVKERESKLCSEVSSLETQLASLKLELEKTRQTRLSTIVTTPQMRTNGYVNGPDARPSSRASTVFGGRSPVTPTDVTYRTGRFPSSTRSPPTAPDSPKGVWGSMHAPPQRASSTHPYPPRSSIPSPTPSTVSLAPTQGDDGWWS